MSLIADVGAALVTAGLIQDSDDAADWRLRLGYMQAAPDRSVAIYPTPGRAPEAGTPADYPGIQVKVRGNPDDYQAVEAKERAIYLFLHDGDPTLIGTGTVYCFAVQSEALPMGQDENRRPALTRNYRFMRVRE